MLRIAGGISVRVNGATVDSAVDRLNSDSDWDKATITWRSGAQRFSDHLEDQLVHVIQVNSFEKEHPQSDNKISVMVIPKAEDERSSSGASSASDCDSDREDGTDSGFSQSRHLTNGKNILTIASYSEDKNQISNPWNMQFYMRELDTPLSTDPTLDSEDIQSKINAGHALLEGRSLKNRVRSSIVSLLVQSTSNRNYDQEEVGRIVFYTTSMGIVRTTFERCRKVRKILETLMVKFEERDVFMNRGFQLEVRERLAMSRVLLPQIFLEGRHLGTAEVIEQLNEIGYLRELLRPYKKQCVGGVCQGCGGYRYLLCPVCGGSKKSITHRHHFSEDLVALRCVTCDESGLIRCQMCLTGEVCTQTHDEHGFERNEQIYFN